MANPNPSPETRFGAENGNPINLAGKTSQQREDEYKAAEISARLRLKALTVMLEKVDAEEIDILDLVEPSSLKLFKDSEDRAHGTPQASTKLSGDPDAPLVTQIERLIVTPTD